MGALKDEIDRASIGRLSAAVQAVHDTFPADDFVRAATAGLERLELKARIAQVAGALGEALPMRFQTAASIVERAVAGAGELSVWDLWPVTVWVGDAGASQEDLDRAAGLLAAITPRMSGEFGVRPLLDADPDRMATILLEWARSDDEHVRRLASEGSRPQLPWAPRLQSVAGEAGWALPVLDLLADDPSPYVRRSVANHLNDIAKHAPALALRTARTWQARGGEHADEVLRNSLRTLVRRGDREALALIGVDAGAAVSVELLRVRPQPARVGESIELRIALRAAGDSAVTAAVDYRMTFPTPSGGRSRKTFRLGTLTVEPESTTDIVRRYTFVPRSTRAVQPGPHLVELIVNGAPVAEAGFELVVVEP